MGFASLSLFYHDIENKVEWYDDDSFGGDLNDPELGRVAPLMKVVKSPVFDLKSTSMELSLRKD